MTYNKKILHALVIMSVLFLLLTVYLTYFEIFWAPQLASSGENPRTFFAEQQILRGSIKDINGEVLAFSQKENNVQKRLYPFNNMYSHIIGYSSEKYGRYGVENICNNYLLGGNFSDSILNIRQMLFGFGKSGADVTLTVDHNLQKKAYNLMGGNKGSIVALNPNTGEVLVMVSKPDFDPSSDSLEKNWDMLAQDENSPLYARSTLGLYAPGSSFKTVVAACAVENKIDDMTFNDHGQITVDGQVYKNFNSKAYGQIDIDKAFAVSSNVAFITMAQQLGANKLKSTAQNFLFNREIPFDITVSKSIFMQNGNDVANAGIGQGDTQATPLHMAMVAAAIANDGIMMKPYIVKNAKLKNGITIYKQSKQQLTMATDKITARRVAQMMIECVKSGTGKGAAINGVTVAGKTGTAENEKEGKEHAWFIAYAPANDPQIAVAAVVEYSGKTGSEACVPMVRELIKEYLK